MEAQFKIGDIVTIADYADYGGHTGEVTAVERYGGEWYCRVIVVFNDGYFTDSDDGSRCYASGLRDVRWKCYPEEYLRRA